MNPVFRPLANTWPPLTHRILRRLATAAAVATVVLVVGVSGARAAESSFVDGFEDLPLMPALTQDRGSATSFDSPYGRIVEAYASGQTTQADVLAFYTATLPQLGWVAAGTQGQAVLFRREGEDLSLNVVQHGAGVTVRFQASPH